MALDLPELFAPARIVRGRISILHSSRMDLYPLTVSALMPRGRFRALAIA